MSTILHIIKCVTSLYDGQKCLLVEFDNGAVLPLRPDTAKNGNPVLRVLARRKDGSRYFSPRGVQATLDVIGGALPEAIVAIPMPAGINTLGKGPKGKQ